MAISQNLQKNEIDFLKFQKRKGVGAEEAFNKLQVARSSGLFAGGLAAFQEKIRRSEKLQTLPTAPEILETPVSRGLTAVAETGKEAAEFFTTQATGEEGAKEGAKNILKNIIPSLGRQGSELIDTVANPVDTAVGLGNLAKGLTDKLVFGILNTVTGKDVKPTAQAELVDVVAEDIKEKYGSPSKLWKQVQQNPALIVELGLSSIKKGGRLSDLSESEMKKIDELTKEAQAKAQQFIDPTKEKTKETTAKIKEEFVERDIPVGTQEEVKAFAKEQLEFTGNKFDEFINSEQFQGELPISKLNDVLTEFENKLIEPQSGLIKPGSRTEFNYILDIRDFLENMANKTGDNLSKEQMLDLKQSFSEVYKGNITSMEKFQNKVQKKLGDTLRAELAKQSPDLAKINKDYSFYKNLNDVLFETVRREEARPEGKQGITKASELRQRIGTGVGASLGASIGFVLAGPTGAGIGGTLGTVGGARIANKIDSVVSSPKYKLIDLNKKKEMINAIIEGKPGKLEKILDTIIANEGIQVVEEAREEAININEQ